MFLQEANTDNKRTTVELTKENFKPVLIFKETPENKKSEKYQIIERDCKVYLLAAILSIGEIIPCISCMDCCILISSSTSLFIFLILPLN